MTPIEFHALMDRWETRENRKFLRAGTIAAAALNPHIDHKKRRQPLTASDFFNLPKPPPKRLTKAELLARAESFFSGHNKAVASFAARKSVIPAKAGIHDGRGK